jgi:hypothetical protein
VRQGVPFDDLTIAEKTHLVWMVTQYRSHMVPELDRFAEYQCRLWSKEQLGRTYTIPRMAPDRNSHIPFLSFIACPRFNEPSDPRVHADNISFNTPFQQTEPIIVLPYGLGPILVDGYLRSVLFMRSPASDDRILVWYPVQGFRLSRLLRLGR